MKRKGRPVGMWLLNSAQFAAREPEHLRVPEWRKNFKCSDCGCGTCDGAGFCYACGATNDDPKKATQ